MKRRIATHNGMWQGVRHVPARRCKRQLSPAIGTSAHAMAASLAAAFTDARVRSGLSQKEVAAAVGVCPHTVVAFESGRGTGHFGIALRLLAHVNVSLIPEKFTTHAHGPVVECAHMRAAS